MTWIESEIILLVKELTKEFYQDISFQQGAVSAQCAMVIITNEGGKKLN